MRIVVFLAKKKSFLRSLSNRVCGAVIAFEVLESLAVPENAESRLRFVIEFSAPQGPLYLYIAKMIALLPFHHLYNTMYQSLLSQSQFRVPVPSRGSMA